MPSSAPATSSAAISTARSSGGSTPRNATASFKIQHGIHVTPLLYGDRIYWSLLHSNAWWVLALDKATGKEIWKVRRETDGTDECKEAYASPVLWRNGKKEYLVVLGCDYCTAHKLGDGGRNLAARRSQSQEELPQGFPHHRHAGRGQRCHRRAHRP